ncbi:hypothetical protein [Asticcacaulis taihuensis]|uniref:hypothetical protein n=1 Tax=Asticcacaulis taihuensis TaxID=260084 RepID=UPI0026F19849|nr:hypothetical protein [Asticcacaulis taihuensis]
MAKDRSCYGPVRAAVGNAFSDEEIDEMVARVADRLQTRAGKNIDAALIRDAVATETRQSMRDALISHRTELSAAKARAWRDDIMRGMPDQVRGKPFDAADKLRAFDAGADNLGANTGFSTEYEGKARFLQAFDRVDQVIEQSGIKGLLDPLFNKAAREAQEDRIAIEMARANGADLPATGDTKAEMVARAFAEALERGRIEQNNVGAWIDRLPGYIAKQNHDRLKVSGGFFAFSAKQQADAFGKWRDFILPLLHADTFKDLDKWDFDPKLLARNGGDVKAAFLEKIWHNIVLGAREGEPGADHEFEFVAPPSKARSASKGRTLHFQDPQAWLAYHRAYGQGSLYQVIASQMEGQARNVALMRRWGPNPEAAREAHLKRAISDVRNVEGPAGAKTAARLNEALQGKGQMANEWSVITGRAGVASDVRIAAIGNGLRIDQRLSKLGGAVLASLGPDQAIAAQVFKNHGGRYLDGYMGAFSGIARLNAQGQKEAGRLMGIGSRAAVSELAGRFDAADGVEGVGAALTNLMFKATGFEFVMEGHRRGLAAMWSSFAASHAGDAFEALPADFRAQLQRFALTAGDWDRMRATVTKAGDGNSYLDFSRLPDDTALKARAYVQKFLDDSLTEPGVREQTKLTGGLARGTLLGEIVRCFTQFKAFPITYVTRHFNPAIAAARAGETGAGGKIVHLILASTVMGLLAMQSKQLAKGLTPRPLLDDDGHPRGDVWLAALLQGGGLGIYGDFLFGEYNRAGNKGVIETISGPTGGEFSNVVKLVSRLTRVDQYDEDTLGDIGADTFQLLKNNTPFMNTWYLRHAIDQLLLFRMQDAISPGYMERYQRRMKDEQGQTFLIKPAA